MKYIFLALLIGFGIYEYFSDVYPYTGMKDHSVSSYPQQQEETQTATPIQESQNEIYLQKPITTKRKTIPFKKPASFTESNVKPISRPIVKPKTHFKCDGRQHCSQMRSYEEAKYFLRNCPNPKMDGDSDGIPCERQFGRYD